MEQYERLAILHNEVEAQMLESVLDEQQIPHAIQSFHDSAFDGIFQMQEGWGAVDGPLSRQQEILQILEELRSQPPLDSDDTAEASQPPAD